MLTRTLEQQAKQLIIVQDVVLMGCWCAALAATAVGRPAASAREWVLHQAWAGAWWTGDPRLVQWTLRRDLGRVEGVEWPELDGGLR